MLIFILLVIEAFVYEVFKTLAVQCLENIHQTIQPVLLKHKRAKDLIIMRPYDTQDIAAARTILAASRVWVAFFYWMA
jgi:hypothetical protein